MSKTKKLLVLMALVLAVLTLAACGGNNGGANGGQGEPGDGYTYVPAYYQVKGQVESINNPVYGADGMIYFYSYEVVDHKEELTEEEKAQYAEWYGEDVTYDWMYEIYGSRIYKVNVDGSGLTQLENYTSTQDNTVVDGVSTSKNIDRMIVGADGNIGLLESTYSWHYDENDEYVDDGSSYTLITLDPTGKEISAVELTDFLGSAEYVWISALLMDPEGNIYIGDGNNNSIYVFTSAGEQLMKLETTNYVENMYLLNDGSVAATSYAEGSYELKKIDLAAKDWGESMTLPERAWNLYMGGTEYDFYYNDGASLYGYSIASEESVPVLNWIDSDVDTNNMSGLVILEDGRVLCINQTWGESGNNVEFVILTKTPNDQVPHKEMITLACYYLDYDLRGKIVEFNKTNPEYRITVKTYSEYDNEENEYQGGMQKLTTELTSGQIPDILVTSNLPMDQYIGQGLFEDLWPYIDNDPELSREDLVTSVFDALSVDGKLYMVGASFNLMTVIGATSVVGPDMGWTIADLNALMEQHPEAVAFPNTARSDILNMLCILNMDDYIDWSTGECHFDSPEFIGLLEFAATFPEEVNWDEESWVDEYTQIQEGKALLMPYGLSDFYDYQYQKALFGGEITFIGFPTSEGVGNRVMMDIGLAMTTKCEHKDAAWQFMRMLLTEEYQEENVWWGMPTNKNQLDQKFADAKPQRDDNPGGDSTTIVSRAVPYYGDEIEVSDYITDEDEAKIRALIDSVSGVYTYNTSMMDIILEGAAPFFAGQKSAADAAAVIQSRVTILVNEQL